MKDYHGIEKFKRMKTRHFILVVLFLTIAGILSAQHFASRSGDTLILDNGIVKRIIQFNAGDAGIQSTSYRLSAGKGEFLAGGSEEFSFKKDGRQITGSGKWKVVSADLSAKEGKGNGAIVVLEYPGEGIRVSVTYILYPGLPIVRKKMGFTNTGT